MQANRGRDTKPELALRRELHRRGWRYRVDIAPLASLRCRGDLVFGKQRVVVFVDGCFWHGCSTHRSIPKANAAWWKTKLSATAARDHRNNQVLSAAGWKVVRVWEHEGAQEAADRVEEALKGAEAVNSAYRGRAGPSR